MKLLTPLLILFNLLCGLFTQADLLIQNQTDRNIRLNLNNGSPIHTVGPQQWSPIASDPFVKIDIEIGGDSQRIINSRPQKRSKIFYEFLFTTNMAQEFLENTQKTMQKALDYRGRLFFLNAWFKAKIAPLAHQAQENIIRGNLDSTSSDEILQFIGTRVAEQLPLIPFQIIPRRSAHLIVKALNKAFVIEEISSIVLDESNFTPQN